MKTAVQGQVDSYHDYYLNLKVYEANNKKL